MVNSGEGRDCLTRIFHTGSPDKDLLQRRTKQGKFVCVYRRTREYVFDPLSWDKEIIEAPGAKNHRVEHVEGVPLVDVFLQHDEVDVCTDTRVGPFLHTGIFGSFLVARFLVDYISAKDDAFGTRESALRKIREMTGRRIGLCHGADLALVRCGRPAVKLRINKQV